MASADKNSSSTPISREARISSFRKKSKKLAMDALDEASRKHREKQTKK